MSHSWLDAIIKDKLKVSSAASLGNAAVVFVGHPFDTIKSVMQTSNTGFKSTCLDIYRRGGVRLFYNGLAPNVTKRMLSSWYRTPLVTEVPAFVGVKTGLCDEGGRPYFSARMLAVLPISAVDTLFGNVFEFAKIKGQTQPGFKYRDILSTPFEATSRAFAPAWLKSSQAWSSFLMVHYAATEANEHITGTRKMGPLALLLTAVSGSVVRVLFTNPADLVKTQIQAGLLGDGCLQKQSEVQVKEVVSKVFSEKGVRGFYNGAVPRGIQSFLPVLAGMAVMELDRVLKEERKALDDKVAPSYVDRIKGGGGARGV